MPAVDEKPSEIAVRAHDVASCLGARSVSEFETLHLLGHAARLAMHLKGVPATDYDLVRQVCVHLLAIPALAVKPVLDLLQEAEFVILVSDRSSIRTVIPNIPYYKDVFSTLSEIASDKQFTEHEELTLILLKRLSQSPALRDEIVAQGADQRLLERVTRIGSEGGFLIERRARGRSVLISPAYSAENSSAYADLVASTGAGRIKKLLGLLASAQGWPLSLLTQQKELNGTALDDADIEAIKALAGDGFLPPPKIRTTHAGENFFIFGPRPGPARLPPFKRVIYESAMALLSSVRQGQLLPDRYAIRSPRRLLESLKEKGFLRASTEALEQYRQLTALRIGRLIPLTSTWYRFELVEGREPLEAIDLALAMLSGDELTPSVNDEIVLALRGGHEFVESMVARADLVLHETIAPDSETRAKLDSFLLRGDL